jgi:hypothetical protein
MSVPPVRIAPRRDLNPAQCRELGHAITLWWESQLGEGGMSLLMDVDGLQSLLAGELPLPPVVGYLNGLEAERENLGLPPFTGAERKRAVENWLGVDGYPAGDLINELGLPGGPRGYQQQNVMAGLRRLAHRPVISIQCTDHNVTREAVFKSLYHALPGELIESLEV